MNARKNILAAIPLICLLCVGGCASKDISVSYFDDSADPWQGLNRGTFAFNEAVDSAVVKPAAEMYQGLPSFVRHRVSNFFANLNDIPTAANNLLQGKVNDAVNDVLRVVFNTTFGILGLFDVATTFGLEKHEEDFGQTLASWGVPSGPYLMVPVLGPSTVRDLPGTVVDFLFFQFVPSDPGTRNALLIGEGVDTRADLLELEPAVRELTPDFYSAVKQFYLARRKALVSDHKDDTAPELYQEIE